ncbi:lysostaphin resistance A-like protein [Candidatus Omnitrophota bacterium]
MIIFIVLLQTSALMVDGGMQKEDKAAARLEFKVQSQERQAKVREVLEKDRALAIVIGSVSLFVMTLLIIGFALLIYYYSQKRFSGSELIPHTLGNIAPSWTLGDVIRVVILFIFFNYLFSILSYTLSGILSIESLDKRTYMTASTTLMDILALLFVLRFVTVKYSQPIEALGLSLKDIMGNIKIGLYAYIGFLPVLAITFLVVLAMVKITNYDPVPAPVYDLIFKEKRPILLIVISALIAFIGPFIEEVFFRGFLYGALKKRLNVRWAIFLSALVFSTLHTNVLGFVPILALGIFFAYLREKTGSLVPSIAVHVVHNSALTSLMFFIRYITSRIT